MYTPFKAKRRRGKHRTRITKQTTRRATWANHQRGKSSRSGSCKFFLMITQFLERILTEHIESICSLGSQLKFGSICSVRIPSRNWDIFKKPLCIKIKQSEAALTAQRRELVELQQRENERLLETTTPIFQSRKIERQICPDIEQQLTQCYRFVFFSISRENSNGTYRLDL